MKRKPLDRKAWAEFVTKYSEHTADRYISVEIILTVLVGTPES
jgi:hypothetical protein